MKKISTFVLLLLLLNSCIFNPANLSESKAQLGGTWVLQKINKKDLDFGGIANGVVLPFTINVNQQNFEGFDSCNSFFGILEKLTNKEIKLGNIASTRKACFGSFNTKAYYEALKKVRYYKLEKFQLRLLNQQNKEVLLFKKQH